MNDLAERRRPAAATTATPPAHVRGGDVFADLDIAPGGIERAKVRLAAAINRTLAGAGATQAARSQALGVAQPVISNLERFELGGISVERLMRYAEYLGIGYELQIHQPDAPGASNTPGAPGQPAANVTPAP